jgi:hypothetical protein
MICPLNGADYAINATKKHGLINHYCFVYRIFNYHMNINYLKFFLDLFSRLVKVRPS